MLSGISADDEIELLERIDSVDGSHPGVRHTLRYYGSFTILDGDRTHTCLVTEPLSISVADHWQYLEEQPDAELVRFPTAVVRNIVKQVLLALSYLHDKCEIIHLGDFILNLVRDIAHSR